MMEEGLVINPYNGEPITTTEQAIAVQSHVSVEFTRLTALKHTAGVAYQDAATRLKLAKERIAQKQMMAMMARNGSLQQEWYATPNPRGRTGIDMYLTVRAPMEHPGMIDITSCPQPDCDFVIRDDGMEDMGHSNKEKKPKSQRPELYIMSARELADWDKAWAKYLSDYRLTGEVEKRMELRQALDTTLQEKLKQMFSGGASYESYLKRAREAACDSRGVEKVLQELKNLKQTSSVQLLKEDQVGLL